MRIEINRFLMDNLHYRRVFLSRQYKNKIPGKSLLKVVKFKTLVKK